MTSEQAIGRIWARMIWDGRKTADDVPEKHWESAKAGAWDLFGMELKRSAKWKKSHGTPTSQKADETVVEESDGTADGE